MNGKFELGQLVATAKVAALISNSDVFDQFVRTCLGRYIKCDWGVLPKEDWQLNNESVETGERLLASYPLPEELSSVADSDRLWIITEWDRSVTTILFPDEY